LVNHGFPSGITYPLAVLAALTEFLGGLAILLGLQTRAAALVLALFVLEHRNDRRLSRALRGRSGRVQLGRTAARQVAALKAT
jgi:hypothetical protein